MSDTPTPDARCTCGCHRQEPIFCSCFVPCCHEPRTPQAQQTAAPPRPPRLPVTLTTFEFPRVRRVFPKL